MGQQLISPNKIKTGGVPMLHGNRSVLGWGLALGIILLCLALPNVLQAGKRDHKISDPPSGFKSTKGAKVGIVLMHGKNSDPHAWLPPLTKALRNSGYWVVTPVMTWGNEREFDASYDDAMAEIKGIIDKLRQGGANKFFVGGHSMGATLALGYAARNPDVDGLLVIAPGHTPEAPGFQDKIGSSPLLAYKKIKAGEGDKRASFNDVNMGNSRSIYTTANIYASFYDVTGPANVKENMRSIGKSTAIFWAIGKQDWIYLTYPPRAQNYIDSAPDNPLHELHVVAGDHYITPDTAKDLANIWIKKVISSKQ